MDVKQVKVCLIGAGPSGMSVMYHLKKLAIAGKQIPQIKCYEKQSACGGLWNYSWRTGKFYPLIDDSLDSYISIFMIQYAMLNLPFFPF